MSANSLPDKALADLRSTYDGLVHLFDKPIDELERATTYKTKEQLVNAFMSQISAIQGFTVRIGLLKRDDVRALFEKYRSERPDIFGTE